MGVHDGHRDRKRQQFLTSGPDPFADHELLEVLLYYAVPRKDTNPIAHELINRFGSLQAVFAAPAAELERVPGLGRNAAVLLKLVPELYRKAILSASANETVLNTTDRIGEFFRDLLAGQSKEVMYQLCLDAKGRKLHVYKLGEGDVGSVGLNVRRIMENALHTNAMMVVLAHNHPSGVVLPSREDETATELAREALDAMGVALVDHIIVADNDYVSLRESGRIRA